MNEPSTFEIREKRWHGCRYEVVRPNNLYNMRQWQDMSAWCVESFGDAGSVWNPSSSRWYENGGAFWFRRPADLTAFMLRWA